MVPDEETPNAEQPPESGPGDAGPGGTGGEGGADPSGTPPGGQPVPEGEGTPEAAPAETTPPAPAAEPAPAVPAVPPAPAVPAPPVAAPPTEEAAPAGDATASPASASSASEPAAAVPVAEPDRTTSPAGLPPVIPPPPATPPATPPAPAAPPVPPDGPAVDREALADNADTADPTTPSSDEPTAGLPTEDAKPASEEDGDSPDGIDPVEALKGLGKEALEEAKEIGRVAVASALDRSRDYIGTLLKSSSLTKAQATEIKRLYAAAEKHAIAGKVAVAHAMAKRINNYIKTQRIVIRSEKARATDDYLGSLLKLVTGAVGTFTSAFGKPLLDSLKDIGLTAVEEWLQ